MNLSNESVLLSHEASSALCTFQAFATVNVTSYRDWTDIEGSTLQDFATVKATSYWTGSEVFDDTVLLWMYCALCLIGNCGQLWWLLGSNTVHAVDGYGNFTFLVIDAIVNLLWAIGFTLFDTALKSCEFESRPKYALCTASAVVSATHVGLSTLVHFVFSVFKLDEEIAQLDDNFENNRQSSHPKDSAMCERIGTNVIQRCFHLSGLLVAIFHAVSGIVVPLIAILVLLVCIVITTIFFLMSIATDYNELRAMYETRLMVGNVMRLSTCKFFDADNIPADLFKSTPSLPIPYCFCCLAFVSCLYFVYGIVASYISDRKKRFETKIMRTFSTLKATLFFVSTAPAVVLWCWWQSDSSQIQHSPGAFIYIAKANEVVQPLGPALTPLLLLFVRLFYFFTHCKRSFRVGKDEELQTLLEATEHSNSSSLGDPDDTNIAEEIELEVSQAKTLEACQISLSNIHIISTGPRLYCKHLVACVCVCVCVCVCTYTTYRFIILPCLSSHTCTYNPRSAPYNG